MPSSTSLADPVSRAETCSVVSPTSAFIAATYIPTGRTSASDTKVRRVVLGSIAMLFLAYISQMTRVSHDMYHAMALFRETLATGAVPLEDVFAYTPTVSPSVHHEWGFGAILYVAIEAMGTGGIGLMALKYSLIGCVMWCCYERTRRNGGTWQLFTALSLLVFPLVWVGCATIRAQLCTLAFLAILLVLLDRDRRGGRWWLLLWIPLHCIWLNVHAGFVVGLVTYGFHCLEVLWNDGAEHGLTKAVRRNLHLPLGLIVMVGCTWLNPYGGLYIEYLWEGIRMERPLIVEWLPLWHTYRPGLALLAWGATVGLTLYALRQNGIRQSFSCLLVLLAAYMAMKHLRHGSLYAVLWLAIVPASLQPTQLGQSISRWMSVHRNGVYGFAWKCCVFSLLVMGYYRVWQPNLTTSADDTTPLAAGAVEYLADSRFQGNLMTPFHAGAYVSWKLHPHVKVSMDGRYEAAYPHGALAETTNFYKARSGWRETLDKYDTDAVLVMANAKVAEELRSLASSSDNPDGWYPAYTDDTYLIFAKRTTQLKPFDRSNETIVASFP